MNKHPNPTSSQATQPRWAQLDLFLERLSPSDSIKISALKGMAANFPDLMDLVKEINNRGYHVKFD